MEPALTHEAFAALWMSAAKESEMAANALREQGALRASTSRYYYAAFQAATAVLHWLKLMPPIVQDEQWEHWGHDRTPIMLEANLGKVTQDRDKRQKLRTMLTRLYRLRLYADYVASEPFAESSVDTARRYAKFVISQAEEILPQNGMKD